MCLKHVGVELPVMLGMRAQAYLRVLYDGDPRYQLELRPGHLPYPYEMPDEFAALLVQDKRHRGEHRPQRLVLGNVDHEPYHFYCARLPGSGLHFPDGTLRNHLGFELWVECTQPLWPYPALFYLIGSDPVVHPFGRRVLWKCHKHWTAAWELGGHITQRNESACGCCMRTRMLFRNPVWNDPKSKPGSV